VKTSILNAAITKSILLFLVLSVSLIPSAISAPVGPTSAAEQCVQKTRGILYSQPSNAVFSCKTEGRKLMIKDFGRMAPAPEGIYKKLADGKECLIGKEGIVLSCNR